MATKTTKTTKTTNPKKSEIKKVETKIEGLEQKKESEIKNEEKITIK